MADREKVIKGLEICIRVQDNEKCPDECPYRKDICYGTVGLMADALSLLKAQEPGWISVKDRLPEEYGNYIAVVDGKATECTYSGPLIKGIITGWSTCESDGMKWLRDEQVTHWMPLPEPPKES